MAEEEAGEEAALGAAAEEEDEEEGAEEGSDETMRTVRWEIRRLGASREARRRGKRDLLWIAAARPPITLGIRLLTSATWIYFNFYF